MVKGRRMYSTYCCVLKVLVSSPAISVSGKEKEKKSSSLILENLIIEMADGNHRCLVCGSDIMLLYSHVVAEPSVL